ncbi:unnamed protein product [Rotaria sordida]|uniref:AAA+ ATPase domain-containing protein n=1 Tax=Rotaria sordida TaxID=392033 RepID=A0A819KU23_9BILA|nr:unnamed protein product [Rotaria sordida]
MNGLSQNKHVPSESKNLQLTEDDWRKILRQGGVKAVLEKKKEIKEQEKKQPVLIAVIGQTGSGKSTLIRRLLGYQPNDPNGPAIGKSVEECTTTSKEYHKPDTGLVYIDLPGIGSTTASCSFKSPTEQEEYATRFRLQTIDYFLLVSQNKFNDQENLLADLSLEINHQYYLSERYVDFNTKKAIQALEQATQLTMEILDDPRQLKKPEAIEKISKTIQKEISNIFSKREPTIKPEGLHMLNKAQQEACEKVKNQRVTLIWGPPGTGKTYWSGVTVFQMLMFSSSPLCVLITACTHAAIDNLLSSINHLKNLFSLSPQFPRWYQLAKELIVLKIESNNYRNLSSSYGKRYLVVGSTVWTLQKLDRSIVFDVIFIDEATQLLTSDTVLAINRLANHQESRLIVAGDPLQLPPVKRCTYPPLPYPIPDLFSSVFHCLLRDENNFPISLHTEKPFEQISRCPYLSIFNENHRMNDQLSDFARLLYGENYRQGRSRPLLSISSINDSNTYLLGSLLQPSSSIYTLLVDSSLFSTCSGDLDLESHLVYSLINELILRISLSSIFIITPHRMQRSAIQQKLKNNPFLNVLITCDTVERMQGKEAQCVILCMLYRQREILDNELDFIYNRQRINVSITRAQQLCILITSQLLFNQPPLELFINGNTRNAYTLLSNYINKSIIRLLDNYGNIK